MRLALAFAVLSLLPLAAAHGDDEGPGIHGDEDLLVGGFSGAQPGPLVVVPYVEDALGCDAPARGASVPLGDLGSADVALNATHLVARFDLDAPTFAALLVDTRDAVRSLIEMQENTVALHDMVAAVASDEGLRIRRGDAGVPYPTGEGHAGHGAPLAEPTLHLGHRGDAPDAGCAGDAAGHFALRITRADLGDALAPGGIVHVVLLADGEIADWLPRPLEGSTAVVPLNLYLTRADEDPSEVRAALAAPAAGALVPAIAAGALLVALAWVVPGRR